MTDYREILRLGSQNYSQRSIAQAAGCSRNTVEKVLRTASAKGVQWPLENDVSNRDLEELLFPEKYRNASMYTEPDYPYIHQELAKPGVTMALLWDAVRRQVPEMGAGDKGHHAHPAQAWRRHPSGLGGGHPSGV